MTASEHHRLTIELAGLVIAEPVAASRLRTVEKRHRDPESPTDVFEAQMLCIALGYVRDELGVEAVREIRDRHARASEREDFSSLSGKHSLTFPEWHSD